LRGCLTEKSLVGIGEPSHARRFASERGEFSPNGSQSGYSARAVGRDHRSLAYAVSGGQALGSGASKGGSSTGRLWAIHQPSTGPPLCDTSRSISVRALLVMPPMRDSKLAGRVQSLLLLELLDGVFGLRSHQPVQQSVDLYRRPLAAARRWDAALRQRRCNGPQ
jgi:hypothetical protein